MVNEKTIHFRIKPYLEEAAVQLIIDIFIMAILSIVLIVVEIPWVICIIIVVSYLIFALNFHYRVVIQALLDKKNENFTTEIVSVKSFVEEYSFAGDRFGHSNIRFFYPTEMHVRKYKINLIDSQGEEKRIRSVMSFRRFIQFAILDRQQIRQLQVTYLKKSKILIQIDLIDEVNNKKISKRKRETIEKAIYFINTSV